MHSLIARKTEFQPIPIQFIAAIGDPNANSGIGAETWGIWRKDPGPRGVWLKDYQLIKSMGGYTPTQWQLDDNDWWVDENGILMESPEFPIGPGKYLVTGDREVTTMLTIYPKETDGSQRWELDDDAKLFDVTHLPCRSARYIPETVAGTCLPTSMPRVAFPISPGGTLPEVQNCNKQDYAVLLIVGAVVKS